VNTWRSWVLTVTAAEAAGFAVPAGVGALTAGSPSAVSVPALLAAGAVEGALLGWGQAVVLRRVLPGFPARGWVLATSAAAVLAYAVGLAPSTLAPVWAGWPPGVLVPLAVLLGLVLLNSIGVAQWRILRRLVPRAGRWIVATALAWLGGLAVFLAVSMPLWHPGQAPAAIVGIGLFAGLLMAATMAAITGLAVRQLVPWRGRLPERTAGVV
jgi:hypothetical protein